MNDLERVFQHGNYSSGFLKFAFQSEQIFMFNIWNYERSRKCSFVKIICAWSDQKQMVNQQATLSSPDIYYIYILFLWLQHNSCLVVVVLFVVVAVMSCLKWKILLAVFLDIFGTN